MTRITPFYVRAVRRSRETRGHWLRENLPPPPDECADSQCGVVGGFRGWLERGGCTIEREREWEMRRMRKRDGDEWDRNTLTHKPCKRKGWRARNTESSFGILRECWRQFRGKGDLSPFIWVSGFARPWPASRWYFVIINRRYINYDRKSVNYHL